MSERTFVMVKPDGVGRRLVGKIIDRYESKGLKLVAMKLQVVPVATAHKHYEEHKGKPFFDGLVEFITSGPSVQMVWEGTGAVEQVRKMNGATNCAKADIGTIRGDFGLSLQYNLVHASDSVETAAREISVYFAPEELVSHTMRDEDWLSAGN